ncbi:chitooligosaccharidolytic beta-N-acetylglucosaminidase [Bicyclus anynana]|uniref:Beta-hexosaminidase n=1 Tax=Bicyclus anynana TaxID=110368 RepID=A0A6J1N624_BICAN|nr:chitooligosaccharidolytic beta-N-acetylglucosaminidase [Bicyclus anynana]XP_052739555.1 chitooligosaccharidolytic beta-N-acetylglucosaminidase [Bicyclus anynana]
MWRHSIVFCVVNLLFVLQCVSTEEQPAWHWSCGDGKCVKSKHDPKSSEPALSLEACKMFCNEYGMLWPAPTGETDLGRFLSKININNIEIQILKRGKSDDLMQAAGRRFKGLVGLAVPLGLTPKQTGKAVYVYLVNENPDVKEFTLSDTDESYSLRVSPESNERINATIFANNFFGIRHGLETLSQLIVFDDIKNHLLIARDVTIDDKPAYPYRGILLDTARNYYSLESIMATIDAMAAVKLNTFHWHITDSQSFPFQSTKRPDLTKYGAYSPAKIYTKDNIRAVVDYALERGIRVLPEFDAPAHVGEGWQDTNLTVCFNAQPWQSFCVEPPCGQLNPVRDELYEYLEDIYSDMAEVFPTDIFHMGGDEVSEKCWNTSVEIQQFMQQNRWQLDNEGFLNLWNYFQTKAQDKVYKAFGKRLPLIMWTSTLTNYVHADRYLNKDDYVIQVWTTGADPQVQGLLKKGYRLILSNYDALYFDCGFGAWVGSGNNWCSPYIGWQKVYENSPKVIAQEYYDQILGGEAALWSEQSDSATLDGRLWPRAAALAERLWAELPTGWQDAEKRMLHARERLVRMGIKAESIEPEWCYQNDGNCYA